MNTGTVLRFRSGDELLEELCLQVEEVTGQRTADLEHRQRFVRHVIRRYERLERYDQDQRALAFIEKLLDGFVEP